MYLMKIEAMYPPTSGSHDIRENIQREDQVLMQIRKFKYLSSTVANNKWLHAELDTRTSKAF